MSGKITAFLLPYSPDLSDGHQSVLTLMTFPELAVREFRPAESAAYIRHCG